jgi:hypothetical protein
MVSNGRGTVARRPMARKAPTPGAVLWHGLGRWMEHVAEDVVPRSAPPVLIAWALIGTVLSAYARPWTIGLVGGMVALGAFVVAYAPAWSNLAGYGLRNLPPLPSGAIWYPVTVAGLAAWPLALSATGTTWHAFISPIVWALYWLGGAVLYALWIGPGPGGAARRETALKAKWADTARDLRLPAPYRKGSNPTGSRLLDVDDVGYGTRYVIHVGHEQTVSHYLTTGKLVERFAAHKGVKVSQVVAKPSAEDDGVIEVILLRGNPWAKSWPHPVTLDPGRRLASYSVLDPVPLAVDPFGPSEVWLTLVDGDGGRMTGVVGRMGSGKTNVLNVVLERLTGCADAEVDFIDVAKGGAARDWAPLCRKVAVKTPDSTGEAEAVEILEEAVDLIRYRELHGETAVHAATAAEPARVIFIDEIKSLVGSDRRDAIANRARELIGYIGTQGRASLVFIVWAAQRGTLQHIGTRDMATNLSNVVVMQVAKPAEVKLLLDLDDDSRLDSRTDMSKASSYGKGALLLVSHGLADEPELGKSLNLSDRDEVRAIVDARRLARPSRGGETETGSVWVETVDGEPYRETSRARRAIEAGVSWVRDRSREPETPPEPGLGGLGEPPFIGLESTAEGHALAAILRLRPASLRDVVLQYEVGEPRWSRAYRIDIYSPAARLGIEVDGPDHDPERDARRDAYLAEQGILVVRFATSETVRDRLGLDVDVLWEDPERCIRKAAALAEARLPRLVPVPAPAPLSPSGRLLAETLAEAGQRRALPQYDAETLRRMAGIAPGNRDTGSKLTKAMLKAGHLVHVHGTPLRNGARYEPARRAA